MLTRPQRGACRRRLLCRIVIWCTRGDRWIWRDRRHRAIRICCVGPLCCRACSPRVAQFCLPRRCIRVFRLRRMSFRPIVIMVRHGQMATQSPRCDCQRAFATWQRPMRCRRHIGARVDALRFERHESRVKAGPSSVWALAARLVCSRCSGAGVLGPVFWGRCEGAGVKAVWWCQPNFAKALMILRTIGEPGTVA